MKASDLMIGDWVYYIHTEDGIAPYKEVVCIKAEDLCCDACIIETHYEPIPLTAEILEKNGFTRFGTDYILKQRHFGLENPSIPSNYLDNYWLRVSIKAVHIEYVHQLQHALRICGIEKEITI